MLVGLIKGFFTAAALNAVLVFLGITSFGSTHYKSPAIVFAASVGLWQWLYLVPLIRRARKAGDRGQALGLIIAGAVAILLVSPCFGLMGADQFARERWERRMVRAVEDPAISAEAFSAALGDQPELSAPLWSTDGMPRSPLDAAVHAENRVAARILLERGAWANEPIYTPSDGKRHTLLFLAIQGCAPDIAELLLAKGATKQFTPAEQAEIARVGEHCAGKPDSEKRAAALATMVQSLAAPEATKP